MDDTQDCGAGPGTELSAALHALDRAIYLLDRGFSEPRKVAAFVRARSVIAALSPSEFADHLHRKTLTDLPGIGSSTARVVTEAFAPAGSGYLEDLELRTAINPGQGGDLRRQFRGDMHTHSTWSDGGATIASMAAAARAIGHTYMAVTDHSPRLTIAHGLTPERLEAQTSEIADLNATFDAGFRLYCGVEVDILIDGSLDLPDDVLEQRDVVVASVHSKLRMDSEEMTNRLLAAVTSPHVDVLGHMTGRMIVGRGRPESTFDVDAVLAACVESNTAIEINCRPERMDPPDDILARAVDAGCTFAINSDAHAPGQLEWVAIGCDRAARAGISAERIMNMRLPAG